MAAAELEMPRPGRRRVAQSDNVQHFNSSRVAISHFWLGNAVLLSRAFSWTIAMNSDITTLRDVEDRFQGWILHFIVSTPSCVFNPITSIMEDAHMCHELYTHGGPHLYPDRDWLMVHLQPVG